MFMYTPHASELRRDAMWFMKDFLQYRKAADRESFTRPCLGLGRLPGCPDESDFLLSLPVEFRTAVLRAWGLRTQSLVDPASRGLYDMRCSKLVVEVIHLWPRTKKSLARSTS